MDIKEILSMCGLYNKPTLISCPTCGRTAYKMFDIIKDKRDNKELTKEQIDHNASCLYEQVKSLFRIT